MELFRLIGRILINNDDANKSIDQTSDKASNAGKVFGTVMGGIGKVAMAAATTVATSTAAMATGIAAITKEAVSSYAEYEQLKGGMETLFGDAAQTVLKNAANAFKDAGISANEYMTTATSFSGALLRTLGNDTQRAAELTQTAIVDMADQANKYGTTVSQVSETYTSLARGNFQTLDNLFGGMFAGTKTGLRQMLEYAEKYQAGLGNTVEYSEESYADIVSAIHDVSESLGVAGTTQVEAEGTITGSLGQVKSAWQNLLTGMADSNQDMNQLINNLVDSTVAFGSNIIPRITESLPRVIEGMTSLITLAAEHLPGIMQQILPALISGATMLLGALTEQVPQILEQLLPGIGGRIGELFTQMIESGMQIGQQLLPLLQNALSQIIPVLLDMAEQLLPVILNTIQQLLPPVIQIIQMLLPQLIDFISRLVPPILELIESILPLVIEILNVIVALLPALMTNAQIVLDGTINIIQGAINIITAIVDSFLALIHGDIEGLINATLKGLNGAWLTIKGMFQTAIGWILDMFVNLSIKFEEFTIEILNSVIDFVQAQIQWMMNLLNAVVDYFGQIKDNISEKLTEAKNTVSSIFDAIKDKIETTISTARDAVKEGIDKIKGFFNFEWKLPDLKLPHFSIDGEFSLNPPKVPSFSIDWYAKAMDNPLLMTQPTAFGINSAGQIMAGGEAGSEVVSGTDTLMNMIASAVAGQNAALVNALDRIFEAIVSMDGNMGDNLKDALNGTALSVNNREFARMVKAVN